MSNIDIFQEEFPSLESYWRSIILFGRNTSSYKFALAKTLLKLADKENTVISLDDIAKEYSAYMCEHLKLSTKQTVGHNGSFIKGCMDFNQGIISQTDLIDITRKYGFNYVLDAFHIVNDKELPIDFFEKNVNKGSGNIILTDSLFKLKEMSFFNNLNNEAEARWNLVETAWNLGINKNLLSVNYDDDKQLLFINSYLKRKDITSARAALNGYQKGKCFYCYRDINTDSNSEDLCDVDHFFPHMLKSVLPNVNLDGVWNLVLACSSCNRGNNGKFAKVPSIHYLERLHKRNEFLISSHHPLRETLIQQTGKTEEERKNFLKEVDKIAINHLIHRWDVEPIGEEVF